MNNVSYFHGIYKISSTDKKKTKIRVALFGNHMKSKRVSTNRLHL